MLKKIQHLWIIVAEKSLTNFLLKIKAGSWGPIGINLVFEKLLEQNFVFKKRKKIIVRAKLVSKQRVGVL